MEPATLITTHNLCKHVKTGDTELTLLNQINIHIRETSAVAITGTSGSGKSTLLSLLAGLDTPTSGSVQLFNHALETLDEDERAKLRAGRVGFVFQSFQLMQGLTALENVCTPLELDPQATDIDQRARAALQQVGLSHRMHHFPSQLSGGEQQRVALARAFVTSPDVLFADEPTGNLDHETGQQIIDLLFSLQRDTGSTLILVTHDEQLAQRCNIRFHLKAGCLIES